MTTQINIRVSEDFLEEAKKYAKNKGYLNIQEFMRDAAREKIYKEEIKMEYIQKLKSREANTFLSEKRAKQFEQELMIRVKQNEKNKIQHSLRKTT